VLPPPARRSDFHIWRGHTYVQSQAPLDDVVFYPQVRYWGMPVYPLHWHEESSEPLLRCLLMGNEIHRLTSQAGLGEASDRAAESEADHQRWLALVEEARTRDRELRTRLVEDGWLDRAGEGLEKYVHVDDLEKIEGPPPEGAF
jgi:hypothetical protein